MMVADLKSRDMEHVRRVKRARVWWNDKEVTELCFYADDVAGVVRCYQVNAQGNRYFDYALSGVQMIERHGKVRIELQE